MRFSEFFALNKAQPYLDFVDVPLDTDLAVFVDPQALRNLETDMGRACTSLVQNYFQAVLDEISRGNHRKSLGLLSALNEKNEFHLGYSQDKSGGRGMGPESAKAVWTALCSSNAAVTGLLQDIEDTCLFIDGIGVDLISDAVCNIIREPLIRYTQYICEYYGIPLTPDVDSGPIWNPQSKQWENGYTSLPIAESYGKVILVPKIIVRHKLSYECYEYYQHYLLPVMQSEELRANTGLVQLLKNGDMRVTKKSLKDHYGSSKSVITEQTIRLPEAIRNYRIDKRDRNNIPIPLSHEQFAEIESGTVPNWEDFLSRLAAIAPGKEQASDYEIIIQDILSALFYPSLTSPVRQNEIHQGRKRIDITYTNSAQRGFFNWVSLHYTAPLIFVECKNYCSEVGNPEIDQLAGRFSVSRGKVGLLVCRSIENPALLMQRCIDTAKDDRGFILPISDEDISVLIRSAATGTTIDDYPLLKDKFLQLIS